MNFSEWIKNRDNAEEKYIISSGSFLSYIQKVDEEFYDDLTNEGIGKYAAPLLMGLGSMFGTPDAKAAAPDVPAKAQQLQKITHKFEDGLLTINIPAKNSSINPVKDAGDIIRMINSRLPRKYGLENKVYDLDDLNKPMYGPDLAKKINSNTGKDLVLKLRFSNIPLSVAQKDVEKKAGEDVKKNKIEHHKWTDSDLELLVRSLNKQLADKNIKLNVLDPKSNFKFYKPKDLIEPDYGAQYKTVIDKAAQAQKMDKSKEMLDVESIENDIPVLFIEPSLLGVKSEGFCSQITIGGKKLEYCVVKSNIPEDKKIATLKHELRHTMQDAGGENVLFGDKLKDNKQERYLFDKDEIAVRLGKMKSQYAALTGKDPMNFDNVWKHFQENQDRYDYDVRQLNYNINIIDRIKLRSGEDLHKEFKDYLRKSWDKVVKADKEQDVSLA